MPPKCSADCGCAGAQYADLCGFEPSCPTCQILRDRIARFMATEPKLKAGYTPGRQAYEDDVAKRPLYNDGGKRRTWQELSDIARRSWELRF